MSIVSDKNRLVLEHRAMRERWGEAARWCCNSGRTVYWWEYTVRVEGNEFPIRVAYPDDYPASPPEIIFDVELPGNTPHVLRSGRVALPGVRMCWFYPGESKRSRNVWNPATDTAAMAIGVAHRWCLAFVVWLSTGNWPVPDAANVVA
jgi:ubiquitin-protein ligase